MFLLGKNMYGQDVVVPISILQLFMMFWINFIAVLLYMLHFSATHIYG